MDFEKKMFIGFSMHIFVEPCKIIETVCGASGTNEGIEIEEKKS